MKAIVLISITFLLFINWTPAQNSTEWTIITVDSVELYRIFNSEKIAQTKLTNKEALKALEIIKKDFDSIKSKLNLEAKSTTNNYRFQLVGGINVKNEKLVFAQGVGKKLPKWIQSKWRSELILLKCTNDELVTIKINLTTKNHYQAYKHDCE